MTTQRYLARVGGAAAMIGAATLVIATLLHPMAADPKDLPAAFAEYAADSLWIASHLAQFMGVVFLAVALVAFGALLENGKPAACAWIGLAGTAASVAAAAALQAIDGVALKLMVDRWAEATGDARERAFEAALSVRQIEIGLAALLSLLFGLTVLAFSIGILQSRQFPHWLGWIGVTGALGTVAAGIAQAYTGFSPVAMTLSMSAAFVLLVWATTLGALMWRLAPALSTSGDAASSNTGADVRVSPPASFGQP